MSKQISYPYLPEGRSFQYVGASNLFMVIAKRFAKLRSLDHVMPGAAVVVRNNAILGIGTNGSDYHNEHKCERIIRGCKSGEGYELCEGCHPKNHSEAGAVAKAISLGNKTAGADLYLWGHWWCCKACWDVMLQAKIRTVYLLEDSEILFNKEHPDNIVGRQFDP